MEFSQKEYLSGLPFPLPVAHILSELSDKTHLSWVAWHIMTHSFTELHKPLYHDKAVAHEGGNAVRGNKADMVWKLPDFFMADRL